MASARPSVQHAQDVLGVPTKVLIQTFVDRILVVVTQMGKVGSLVQVTMSSAAPMIPPLPPPPGSENELVLPEPSASIVLSPLFGAPPPALGASSDDAQTMQSIYVSQIATLVWTHDPLTTSKPVVVGLALKKLANSISTPDAQRSAFLGVMKLVMESLRKRDEPASSVHDD
ncbi:hypothetical protein EXIGLDRAFT_774441 [Exidia glandulosa HHB12029]|uniref:Proteasome assembly chaperone 3 n=1 Tax=Exidia glandulosa HHB12029 TaxID=1314781 RepID=A0A165ECU6_EXIGL|nr:hypothetical protein EXIGLDRAFT_774441 [Exidia glandulosa HHB12029]